VAVVAGALYLAYDVAIARGIDLPGGDLRAPAFAAYIVVVLAAGAAITYLIVPQPTGGRPGPPRRSAWSAALGFLAAVPIAYLVMVVVIQVLEPLLT
jgi:hypothetical protein